MRRVILWIVAILITFTLGTSADSLRRYLFTKESPATAKVEVAAPVVVNTAPTPESALESAPAPNLILDYDQRKINHYGALYIMGPAPEGFRHFESIALGLSGSQQVESSDFITVYAGANGEWAEANFALVTEEYLYFTTAPSHDDEGFQYRFKGQFLVKDFDAVEGKNKAAVRGKLTKSKNGRTIAEQTITFRVEYMGC